MPNSVDPGKILDEMLTQREEKAAALQQAMEPVVSLINEIALWQNIASFATQQETWDVEKRKRHLLESELKVIRITAELAGYMLEFIHSFPDSEDKSTREHVEYCSNHWQENLIKAESLFGDWVRESLRYYMQFVPGGLMHARLHHPPKDDSP